MNGLADEEKIFVDTMKEGKRKEIRKDFNGIKIEKVCYDEEKAFSSETKILDSDNFFGEA